LAPGDVIFGSFFSKVLNGEKSLILKLFFFPISRCNDSHGAATIPGLS